LNSETVSARSSVFLREPRLATQPGHVAICLPGLQLPGIDDLLPLGEQEVLAEFVPADRLRRVLQQRGNCAVVGQIDRPDVHFVQAGRQAAQRVHVDSLGQSWLAAQESVASRQQSCRERVRKRRQ
jgi:hypothetical protein